MVVQGQSIRSYVPTELFQNAPVHTLAAGERAILARLRTMSEEEFSVLPYGGEGLWRKLMHESRRQPDLESILAAVKSKRYTRTRLDRMVMCAFLGIDQQTMSVPAPYARILGFDRRGRELLALTRKSGFFLNVGTRITIPTAFFGAASRPSPTVWSVCCGWSGRPVPSQTSGSSIKNSRKEEEPAVLPLFSYYRCRTRSLIS